MAKWTSQTFPMVKNHGWKVRSGYKSFVADQGAVRFDIPHAWVFMPDSAAVKFHDKTPPDDTCTLEATVFYLPSGVDWSGFPMSQQLREAIKGQDNTVLSRGDIVSVQRSDLEIVWLETRYVDAGEHREACARTCLARKLPVELLITFSFWPEGLARLNRVWGEVLRSMRLAEYVVAPYQRDRN